MYRKSDYPKDKVSFSPNEVEEQSVTCATRAKPSVSHEDIEAGQAIDEAEVEEDEEEYDSDSDDPTADSDEDNLMFLRAVTTRSGRMVRVVCQEL